MGNLINLPNITLDDSVLNEDTAVKKPVKNNVFDEKNYLNVRLDAKKGETEKTLTIRLLPMDLETGNPFVKVHMHNMKVPKEVSASGYKSYICLAKNEDIDHETYGYKCPFCELNHNAYELSLKETDPIKQKDFRMTSLANMSREAVIVRCIERGKENEGVKFWKFNLRSDKSDPYHSILKLYSLRKAEGERAGQSINILDIYNGRDLNVTIKEGKAAPQILDASINTPLSRDEEEMRAWIYDPKRWQDVFVTKPYEYLSLVSQMKVPWYDRERKMWVAKKDEGLEEAKEEFETTKEEFMSKSGKSQEEFKADSEFMGELEDEFERGNSSVEKKDGDFMSTLVVNEDDLPL